MWTMRLDPCIVAIDLKLLLKHLVTMMSTSCSTVLATFGQEWSTLRQPLRLVAITPRLHGSSEFLNHPHNDPEANEESARIRAFRLREIVQRLLSNYLKNVMRIRIRIIFCLIVAACGTLQRKCAIRSNQVRRLC